jgi:dihydrodipicolinate synthase/N-acetylneuraminate lyase
LYTPRGLIGCPVTPLRDDGSLDLKGMEKLIDFLIVKGVDGLALTMHLGESLNLSSEERKKIVEVSIKTAAGRVPVIVHVSLPGTRQVLDLACHAQEQGADGVIVITPYYWTPPRDVIMEHFTTICRELQIGVTGYHFPQKLGVALTVDMLTELMTTEKNFVALKDASFDIEYLTEVCRTAAAIRPDFAVLPGIEYVLPTVVIGAAGSLSACMAVAPNLVKALFDACARGEYAKAKDLQYRVSRLYHAIRVDYPAGIKAAQGLMGRDAGGVRLPVRAMNDERLGRIKSEMTALGLFESEPRGWS